MVRRAPGDNTTVTPRTGGLEGGPIAGYVGGLMKALVLGLLAGESSAAN